MTRLVKYSGIADGREVSAGETFGGRYPAGLENTLSFGKETNWVVPMDGVPDEVVDMLLEDPASFIEVTGLDIVPPNLHQQTFLAMGVEPDPDRAIAQAIVGSPQELDFEPSPKPSKAPKPS